MKFISIIERAFTKLLPSPFSIALVLTVVTFILAWIFTKGETSGLDRGLELVGFWEKGLWEASLLAFAVQMMLMLVLGHVLALTKPVDRFISNVTQLCTNTATAAALVTLLTVIVALFNWGLGLIFGAILARKVGEHAAHRGIQLNYALIGAAGYSGLMVWHGGISGSAPIKAAEDRHLHTLMADIVSSEQLRSIPAQISPGETTFGAMNIVVMLMLIAFLPAFMYYLGKRSNKVGNLPDFLLDGRKAEVKHTELVVDQKTNEVKSKRSAEYMDVARGFSLFFGGLIFIYCVYLAVKGTMENGLQFITPNYINLLLLSLGLLVHTSIHSFLKAVDKAIGGTSGILIQFPLYFGIMGIMKYSGLVNELSDFFVAVSNSTTFPIFTFFSAGIVNVFVPSGGGQWAVQGPIIVQAATDLNVSLPKAIMALSYGDQLTNMLQPFWALPLLGITGLKAKSILPYTVALMGAGALIFIIALLIF